jgi:YggT family protein
MNNALADIVHALFDVACFLFLARFILQASRADFYNPVSQGIIKVTDPVLRPLRLVVKGFRNFDIAAFVTAWLVQFLAYALIARFGGELLSVASLAVFALYQVIELLLAIYSGALILVIVMSWVSPGSYHPMAQLLTEVTDPLLAPVRRLMPPVGGLDFSVMVVLLLLMLARNYLLPAILVSLVT